MTKAFNLKKLAQEAMPPMDPMGLNDSPELNEPEPMDFGIEDNLQDNQEIEDAPQDNMGDMPKFKDGSDVKNWLDTSNTTTARTQILNFVQDMEAQQRITDMIDLYYQADIDENQKLKISTEMFELLPEQLKEPDMNDQSIMIAPYTQGSVKETENIIKTLAAHVALTKTALNLDYTKSVIGEEVYNTIRKANKEQLTQWQAKCKQEINTTSDDKRKSKLFFELQLINARLGLPQPVMPEKQASVKLFNLKKTAQHKGFENVIMFGPDQVKVDPFLRQPVSNLALLERNKGFGLVIDDIWDIDYESIWRSTIMDKYSRPYRDKEGNWVGGYIQKRFEVDKNIPITNNMQLKPGQRIKPILPEYGLIEARLEVARDKITTPYNLVVASNKKKSNIREAQLKELKPLSNHNEYLDGPKAGFETICTQCGSTGPKVTDTQPISVCQNCGGKLKTLDGIQRKVDQPGKQYNPYSTTQPQFFQKNTPIASNNNSIKESSLPTGKNGKRYRTKNKFISEDFKQCPKKPNNYDDIVREISESCDDLAIDG